MSQYKSLMENVTGKVIDESYKMALEDRFKFNKHHLEYVKRLVKEMNAFDCIYKVIGNLHAAQEEIWLAICGLRNDMKGMRDGKD